MAYFSHEKPFYAGSQTRGTPPAATDHPVVPQKPELTHTRGAAPATQPTPHHPLVQQRPELNCKVRPTSTSLVRLFNNADILVSVTFVANTKQSNPILGGLATTPAQGSANLQN